MITKEELDEYLREPKFTKEEWFAWNKARFLSMVSKPVGINSCWEWIGNKDGNGNAQFLHRGKKTTARRVTYEFMGGGGPLAKTDTVYQACKNPGCVNPDHLELRPKGQVPQSISVLKTVDVGELCRQFLAGVSLTDLANTYQLSKSLVWAIAKAKNKDYHG